MKHAGKFVAMAVLVAGMAALNAGALFGAGLTGTPHDFSGKSWSGGQICLPCHTPHGGSTTAALWNHAIPSSSDFTMESNSALLSGESLTCLGCHDGQTAIDAYGGSAGTPGFVMGTGGTAASNNIGRDLEDDHPVGVPYPTSGLGTSWGSITVSSRGSNQVDNGAGIKLTLYGTNKSIQCRTCHTPHDNSNGDFLRASNAGSAVCLTCHLNKK